MTKRCFVCGKEFTTYQSRIKLDRGKYCSKECCLKITNKVLEKNGIETRWKKGQMPKQFKGYKFTTSRKNGGTYKCIYYPSHPFATSSGHIREHRLIMEKSLGRFLKKDEIVHHKDGNTLNNNLNNLEVLDKITHDRMNVNLNIHRRWIERKIAI